MVSLKPLELVGYSRAFFKLPVVENQKQMYTWYTFDSVYPPDKENYWNLVGLRSRAENALLFDIQFIYVDDDTLSWEDFEPLRDVSASLSIGPSELVALIQFLEETVGHTLLNEESTLQHFHFLNADDLANLKFTQLEIDIHKEACYRYILDKDMSNADRVNLFSLPQWIRRAKITQGTMLNFVTFDRQQLANPKFRPLQIRGLTTVTFNQRALEEFILLLKRRTYEVALRLFTHSA